MPNLAAKYRPRTWDEVVEQKMVIHMVKGLIDNECMDVRNFLFTGPAGCAKTTICRILANVLNEGKGEPIEIDAASNSGVDNMRTIIDQARSYPVGTKWKIFIIDECFHGDSLVHTTSGMKQIRDIAVGDQIYNFTGKAYVKNKFRNKVDINNLVFVTVSGKRILTTKSHLFFTDDGWVEAQYLKKGDVIYDYKTMCDLRKRVQDLSQRQSHDLRKTMRRSLEEGTTQDISQELCSQLFDEDLSDMRKNISDISFCRCKNLFSKVWSSIHEASRTYTEAERSYIFSQSRIYLSNLWKAYDDTEQRSSKDVQRALRAYLSAADEYEEEIRESCAAYILCDMWKHVCTKIQRDYNMLSNLHWEVYRDEAERSKIARIINSDEASQSNGITRVQRESSTDEIAQRYFASSLCAAWRKRDLYEASDSFEKCFRRSMGVRVSCKDRNKEKQQPNEISYELQTRPRLSFDPVRSRGGWDRAQYEGAAVSRRKESNLSTKFRVEGVEVYQSGDNDRLFRSCFKDSEIHGNYVDMYDLEVDGHPSYFVEDILVHNCHAFSNSAWQAALKTFEEPPAKTIFMMATTNPEKIPPTILSRVQQFRLSKISVEGIENRLKYIVDQENKEGQNITYTEDAISYIAKMANGGMRDAITLLEKAIASDSNITSQSLMTSLGLPNYDQFFELLQAYASKDNAGIAKIIDEVYNSGVNFAKWMTDFHAFTINVVKYILLKDISKTMIPGHYEDKIKPYGNAHLMICLKLASKLVKLNNELRFSQYQQELTLTYLCSVVKK